MNRPTSVACPALRLRPSSVAALLLVVAGLLAGCSSTPTVSMPPVHFVVAEGAEGRRFRTADDLTLFGQWWVPSGPVRATVLLLHGTGVHTGFYNAWANEMAANGYAVFGLDLRGWGQSQGFGARGYVGSYDEYVADAALAYKEIKYRYRNKQVFVVGDSMGADVALLGAMTSRVPADGLVLLAPAVKPNPGVGWLHVGGFSVATAATLAEAMPTMAVLPMAAFAKLAFDDPEQRQRFDADPFCVHTALPAAYLIAMEDASRRILEHSANLQTPVIILQGSEDNLVPQESSQKLAERMGSKDKIYRVYDKMSHELLHDTGHREVWADIQGWIDARVDRRQTSLKAKAEAINAEP